MKTYSQMTPLELRGRIDQLEKELGAFAPEIFDEIKALRQYIAKKDNPRTVTYAEISVPWLAIAKCLDSHGDFKMGKFEVREEIINGGYDSGADGNANDLIRDAINYHIRKGRIEVKKGLLGRTQQGHLFAG